MKRILLCLFATGAFFVSGMVTSTLMAQPGQVPQGGAMQPAAAVVQPAAAAPQQTIAVAVVDYEYLVMIHPKRYATSQTIQKRVELESANAKTEQQRGLDIQRKLQNTPPGTQEHTQLTTDIRRIEAELQINQEKVLSEIQKEQVYALYGAYTDIKGCVERYAKHNNILVVINSPDLGRRLPQEPSQALMAAAMHAEFNPTAIWTHPQLDITLNIENMLNDMYAGSNLPKVNFEDIKKQVYGNPQAPGGGAPANSSTNVAIPNGQQPPRR